MVVSTLKYRASEKMGLRKISTTDLSTWAIFDGPVCDQIDEHGSVGWKDSPTCADARLAYEGKVSSKNEAEDTWRKVK